jgi:hypothetical protein
LGVPSGAPTGTSRGTATVPKSIVSAPVIVHCSGAERAGWEYPAADKTIAQKHAARRHLFRNGII